VKWYMWILFIYFLYRGAWNLYLITDRNILRGVMAVCYMIGIVAILFVDSLKYIIDLLYYIIIRSSC
jgi:hypothetical protein